MLTKKELKDNLQEVEELILMGEPKSYSEYKYYIGKRDMLMKMLEPRKRKPKKDIPTRKLQEFGLENPIGTNTTCNP